MNKPLKDMTLKEIEIEFDKLEDKVLCLEIDIEEKNDVIQYYMDMEEENCAMRMRRSY